MSVDEEDDFSEDDDDSYSSNGDKKKGRTESFNQSIHTALGENGKNNGISKAYKSITYELLLLCNNL